MSNKTGTLHSSDPFKPASFVEQPHIGARKEVLNSSTTRIVSTSSFDVEERSSARATRDTWRPSFYRIRPLIGLAALGVSLLCLLASLAVLIGSNGEPTANWHFQPTVYLAIATAISNKALYGALSQAASIAWWNKAVKGTTIRDLELEWEAGQSFPRAVIKSLRQGRFVGLLSIAGLATALVLVDGPLLQRASTVRATTLSKNTALNISLSPEVPRGFSGLYIPRNYLSGDPAADAIGDAYTSGKAITSNVHCNGPCAATVRGPGLVPTACVSHTWRITESILKDPSSTWGSGGGKPVVYSQLNFPNTLYVSFPEELQMTTGTINFTHCQGWYVEKECKLLSAILEYDIVIEGDVISFTVSPSSARVVALANNTMIDPNTHVAQPVTFTGFAIYMGPALIANASLVSDRKGELSALDPATLNELAWKHVNRLVGSTKCHLVTTDPANDILSVMDNLMFRSGLEAASWPNTTHLVDPNLSMHQNVQANQTQKVEAYRSDLRWFSGAAAIQVVTILLILPNFWGWWSVGIETTLSPFHIAKLLDAPLLRDVNSAAGAAGVVRGVGDTQVKLEVVEVRHLQHGVQSEEKDRGMTSGSRL